jgi:hypothetical protein
MPRWQTFGSSSGTIARLGSLRVTAHCCWIFRVRRLVAGVRLCRPRDLARRDVVATDRGRIVRIDTAAGTIQQLNRSGGAFIHDGALIADATLETPGTIATDAAGRNFLSDCGSHPLCV